MENQEIWKDIAELNFCYAISNYGNVKRNERVVLSPLSSQKGNRTIKSRPTNPQDNGKGYLQLYVSINSKRKMLYVHRLVALYFIGGNIGLTNQVNHIDGNKKNNHYTNLEWCTNAQNMKHAVDTGLMNTKGENSIRCKIKESTILAIRRLNKINPKFNKSHVARKLGVRDTTIHKIIKRQRWKHI